MGRNRGTILPAAAHHCRFLSLHPLLYWSQFLLPQQKATTNAIIKCPTCPACCHKQASFEWSMRRMCASQQNCLCCSATSNYWLHNVIGSNAPPPTSPYYTPDTATSRVTCQSANQTFIGLRASQTYGGIDYLEFVCAPTCYNLDAGQQLRVGVNTVTVGEALTESLSAPAPSSQTCPTANIGPGSTYQAPKANATAVRSVCPGEWLAFLVNQACASACKPCKA